MFKYRKKGKKIKIYFILVCMFILSYVFQVSRCEKFGYGVMVTQVAGTAAGAVALQKSGKF